MAANKRKHVLVMCLPAFGHYIPGLELAKKIIPYHDVTFVVSVHKLANIKDRDLLPPAGPAPIKLHTFDDGFTFNIDENLEDLRGFTNANLQAKPHYAAFINSLALPNDSASGTAGIPPVDAIFCDITMPMPFQPSSKRDIPIYGYLPQSATIFCSYSTTNEDTPTVPDDVFFSGVDESFNKGNVLPESFKKMQAEYDTCQSLAKGIFLNSFEELEPDALGQLKSLSKYANTLISFIGPLLPTKGEPVNELSEKIGSWLDKQQPRSVVYFSFGTVAVPSAEQLVEVAEALTSLKRPFIWSLRSYQQDLLPEKFVRSTAETITEKTPYLILHWTPQKQILSHPSTAVFVSHCGWNSTLEAVSLGVPVVAWPMLGDQHNNAALIEQWGIGRSMPVVGMKSKAVHADQIAEVITEVAGWNEEAHEVNPYLEMVLVLSKEANMAIGPNGKSTKNFLEIMNIISH